MRITTTVENLKEQFATEFPENEKQRIYETYANMIDYEKAADMLSDICDNMTKNNEANPEDKAAFESWTPFDKMAWIVKEAFIAGVLQALDVSAAANAQGLQAIIDAQPTDAI